MILMLPLHVQTHAITNHASVIVRVLLAAKLNLKSKTLTIVTKSPVQIANVQNRNCLFKMGKLHRRQGSNPRPEWRGAEDVPHPASTPGRSLASALRNS